MRCRTLASLAFTLIAGFGFSSPLSAQTVYKSVDDAGQVVFTDRPPMQQNMGDKPLDVLDMQIKLTDPALIAANRQAAASNARGNKAAKEIREGQEAEDAAKQASKDAQRAENCDLAKMRLTRYSQARRLYRDGADGEREYLTEAEIDSERASAVRAVDEWCGQ